MKRNVESQLVGTVREPEDHRGGPSHSCDDNSWPKHFVKNRADFISDYSPLVWVQPSFFEGKLHDD